MQDTSNTLTFAIPVPEATDHSVSFHDSMRLSDKGGPGEYHRTVVQEFVPLHDIPVRKSSVPFGGELVGATDQLLPFHISMSVFSIELVDPPAAQNDDEMHETADRFPVGFAGDSEADQAAPFQDSTRTPFASTPTAMQNTVDEHDTLKSCPVAASGVEATDQLVPSQDSINVS
jgi:hypothetical protein